MITIEVTGLDQLKRNFETAPDFLAKALQEAIQKSVSMVEGQAKKLAPVKTGNLRSSIGGVGGYSFVRGLTGAVGTNLKYAYRQEITDAYTHRVGQAHYMQDGVTASQGFIEQEFQKALEALAEHIVK